ncbi:MAG: hypothetical protein FWG39_02250 [Alphaproteobacteria bacterium]|nr:hypothetical protein [Alphaproteobacteria bacterium]
MKKIFVGFFSILIFICVFFPTFGIYIPPPVIPEEEKTEEEKIAESFWDRFEEYAKNGPGKITLGHLYATSVCVRGNDYKQTLDQEKVLHVEFLRKAAKEIYGVESIEQDEQGMLLYNGNILAIKNRVDEFNGLLADFKNIEQVRNETEKQFRDNIKYVKNFTCSLKSEWECEEQNRMKQEALVEGEEFNCKTVFEYQYVENCLKDVWECWFRNIVPM